ncbi:MAG: peptidase [Acidobacteria bacterium]|nr:peptidase [Acidobacteriota bacterium]
MGFLLILLDGVGVGEDDPKRNPFARLPSRYFPRRGVSLKPPFYGTVREVDARLSVPGLPQSATGQTSILTGINAAMVIGKHLPSLPNRELVELLAEYNILKILKERGKKVAFANAYRPDFLNRLIRRVSVTTASVLASSLPIFTLEDLNEGKAIYQDFTNHFLIERGYPVSPLKPEEAGRRLANISASYDFTLYEYFKTDIIGHRGDLSAACTLIAELENFLTSLLSHINLDEETVAIISDHGNLEDLSTKEHTENPVPLLAFGREKKTLIDEVASLTDLTPAILSILG